MAGKKRKASSKISGVRNKAPKENQINFRVDNELYQRLVKFDEEHDLSFAYICRKALREYLDRAGK